MAGAYAVNVETQQANPSSLLWWTKRMIALRKQRPVFGSGSMQILQPTNPRVFAFVRTLEGDSVLVVVNFSRFVQYVELDLSEFRGARPRELIGGARSRPSVPSPTPWPWDRIPSTGCPCQRPKRLAPTRCGRCPGPGFRCPGRTWRPGQGCGGSRGISKGS